MSVNNRELWPCTIVEMNYRERKKRDYFNSLLKDIDIHNRFTTSGYFISLFSILLLSFLLTFLYLKKCIEIVQKLNFLSSFF